MNRSVIMLASAAVSFPALVVLADPQSAPQAPPAPSQPTAAPAQPQAATAQPSNTNPDGSLKVVVHRDRAVENTADSRVEAGGVRISMPDAAPGVPAMPSATPGTISVPLNTIGPGTPMWIVREREDADRKIAQAEADVAKAAAERTDAASAYYQGYSLFSAGFGYGAWSRGAWGGLRGPVTTTTVYSDQLGSTAQRAFHDASYPRLNGSQDAHDRAVQQYGRDATPPINRIQNDIDEAHRRANTEHPTK